MVKVLIGLAAVGLLILLFYGEEDWRGKHAWENCQSELKAKGEVLDWSAYIPSPVPDSQNFFKAPHMTQWFVRSANRDSLSGTNALYGLITNAVKTAVITNRLMASNFLTWSDQFQPQFSEIREALKRPYARMDGDYAIPYKMPIPDFVTIRALVQVLAQRAHCWLLLGKPEKALDELSFLNHSRRMLEAAPTGKPMTLVSAMINVAIVGLYVDTITKGLNSNAWHKPQLIILQGQLAKIHLLPLVVQAYRSGAAGMCHTLALAMATPAQNRLAKNVGVNVLLEITSPAPRPLRLFFHGMPSGWIYQNMTRVAHGELLPIQFINVTNQTIEPAQLADSDQAILKTRTHLTPYNFLAAIAVPNITKAMTTVAFDQTWANEAQIVCALERFRLTNGHYPKRLEELVPQFITQLPHDIIGGKPLQYHRTADGKFLLYSIGWNETDDGGQISQDHTHGDWVWPNL